MRLKDVNCWKQAARHHPIVYCSWMVPTKVMKPLNWRGN